MVMNIFPESMLRDRHAPLIALGATVTLRDTTGTRTLKLEDYFIAYGKQDRKSGEFVEKITVPAKSKNTLFKPSRMN